MEIQERISFIKKISGLLGKCLHLISKILIFLLYVSGFLLIIFGMVLNKFEYSFSGFLLIAIHEIGEIRRVLQSKRMIAIPTNQFIKILSGIARDKYEKKRHEEDGD